MKKNSKKKLTLGKIRIASLSGADQKAAKGASILAGCNSIAGGCIPTHYNTCGDCVQTIVEC